MRGKPEAYWKVYGSLETPVGHRSVQGRYARTNGDVCWLHHRSRNRLSTLIQRLIQEEAIPRGVDKGFHKRTGPISPRKVRI
eukprot:2689211-Ditylum_brightwellii.AAC.1